LNTTPNKKTFCAGTKGMIFSFDAMIAFIIMLFMISVFALTLGNYSTQVLAQEQNFFLEEKTIFVADAFVKNYNSDNALLGGCIIDLDKKRVKSNEISSALLNNTKQIEIEGFFVKEAKIKSLDKTISKIFLSDNRESEQCIAIKRFVLIDGKKALVLITGCLIE